MRRPRRSELAVAQRNSLRADVGNLQLGVAHIPLLADAFEDEAERLVLAGREWGSGEIRGVGIGTAGFKDFQRDLLDLRDLAVGIAKRRAYRSVGDGFVA